MIDQDAEYHREAWMSDDQWECAKLFARLVGGFHHVVGTFKPAGYGIRVSDYASSYATFDFDRLTALVFMAHDACIRVQLSGSSPHRIGLMLHRRHKRQGCIGEHHPTIEAALERWRQRNPIATTPDAGEGL